MRPFIVSTGMIGLSAYLMPNAKIRTFVWFLHFARNRYIPAWILAVWYIGWDTWDLFVYSDNSGINLVAHVSGGIAGYLIWSVLFEAVQRRNTRGTRRGDRVQAKRGEAVQATFSEDELQNVKAEQLVPNVRLVNGSTGKDTCQRLMLAFNTPFYPEILIASSVLTEGVDLHLNCRHVIHHDLSWNPSSLEQRNGRIDRIGAKAERCGQPIEVYYPYIAETQDDKMYQVVMDRDHWFNVVMGERYNVDARSTDKLAERLPFPEEAARALAFKLAVADE